MNKCCIVMQFIMYVFFDSIKKINWKKSWRLRTFSPFNCYESFFFIINTPTENFHKLHSFQFKPVDSQVRAWMYFFTAEESCDREKIPQSMCLPKFEPHSIPMNAAAVGEKSISKNKIKINEREAQLVHLQKSHCWITVWYKKIRYLPWSENCYAFNWCFFTVLLS